ncbi:MAG: hypothetical protein K6E11_01535 [Bacilli bacterium]|nr:hypothetical protein [Bacilli bacterium]
MAINENNKDIKITLSKAQFEYLEALSKKEKVSKSKIIASLLSGLEENEEINESKDLRQKINRKHILNGVIIEDPNNTYIGKDVEIEAGTVIKPNTVIEGKCHIGKRNIIGPNSYLENMDIGDDNSVIMSHLVDSKIGNKNQVGPFARMRGHSYVENNSRVGNFVEMKGAHLHEGAKSAHLTYLGDCEIGERTNIGCGTITANYDGYNKSRTTIGKDVFIGSGSILIAPITVEDEAFVAAGGVITKDVKKDELAIARAKQENRAGYSHIIKNRARAKKEASQK